MKVRFFAGLTLAGLLLLETGCCTWRRHGDQAGAWQSQPVYPGGPAPAGARPETLMPTNPTPNGGAPALSPIPSGYTPSSSIYVAPSHSHPGVPPSLLPPTRVPVDTRYYAPPRQLPPAFAPKFDTSEPPFAPVNPFTPSPEKTTPKEQTNTAPPPLPAAFREPDTKTATEPAAPAVSPKLPDGIPLFAEVKKGIATARRPEPDGLDWLKANGYRAVLHVSKPGAATSSDREQVEKRGLKYLALEVSPETLAMPLVEQFNQIVGDKSNHALLVYDKDGSLAGALWYLHLRTAEKSPPEAARIRAEGFGLKSDATGEQAPLWIAIQKIAIP